MGILSGIIDRLDIYWIIFGIPSIFIASSFHEFAHAWSAYKLGDYTAKLQGRMTLNPISHIDPVGAVMMVIAKFGWSKPVPINANNFKDPLRDMALSAFAGPLANIILVLITGIPLKVLILASSQNETLISISSLLSYVLIPFISINIVMAVFNLIPVPPLDGYRILSVIIPPQWRETWVNLESYAFFLLALIILPVTPIGILVSEGITRITTSILGLFV